MELNFGTIAKNFIKWVIIKIDSQFETSLYEKMRSFVNNFHENYLNSIRRKISPAKVRIKERLGIKYKNPLKLHLGCGDKHFEGFINIDWRKTKATDLVCNINKLPYPDNSVELIETYHVIEHLPRHELPKVLKRWYRILKPRGQLVIECPNFDEAVKEYLNGNEKRLDNIFGLQRFSGDAHLFGYNFRRLRRLLEDVGFKDIQEKAPTDYHASEEPCLRVECIKGE